jgi:hypothetical protein
MKHSIRVNAELCHLDSLSPVLRESIDNPASFRAVSELDANGEHVNKGCVVDF